MSSITKALVQCRSCEGGMGKQYECQPQYRSASHLSVRVNVSYISKIEGVNIEKD